MDTKMKTAHMPGPWRACVGWRGRPADLDTDDVATANGDRICRMTGDVAYTYANARLIAAAPALLEALRECYRRLCPLLDAGDVENNEPMRAAQDALAAARAALAQAEGRAQ